MKTDIFSLSGKVALVTGGATGIGFGIARSLAAAGAAVIIAGRTASKLKEASRELGPNVSYIVFDITKRDQISPIINQLYAKFGHLDILVNNAGTHLKKNAIDTSDEEMQNIMDTNLTGVFSVTRECINKMILQKSGVILFISSMTALFGMEKVVAYGASKAALKGLMINLVAEISKYNVRVNTIAPGWIETNMFTKAIENDPERKNRIIQRIALPGFGQPEDIGHAALFLCSDAARYITGALIPIDGGASVNF